ncbi:hypothetical protein GCM10022286_21890 [Gryllotalpicola daejeonensis]|uniref:Signal peptidase I n=1 Tax=Gryllotalpicola daejeonensis TaxID=993087 RepID=A0ABP7ZL85_9MICO
MTVTDTAPEPTASAGRPSAGARASRIIRTVLLDVTAAAGAVCIVLVVLALVFHLSLIMFRTGSMSPTIPTGSLAMVHHIPAEQAHVGDVVTVERPGELPITHRLVSSKPDAAGGYDLVLKGDANAAADPVPYHVTTVGRVVWHAPGLARVIVWFSNPFVLGGLAMAVAALVAWVLWPRQDP